MKYVQNTKIYNHAITKIVHIKPVRTAKNSTEYTSRISFTTNQKCSLSIKMLIFY